MLRLLVLTCCYCISPWLLIEAIPIDNGVDADPSIVCLSDRIQIDFKTRNPFEGHVYVKGRYNEPGCRTDGVGAGARAASISVPFSKCGVLRTRSLNPRGVYARTVVVITFHPQFLTKVDRAYAIQCFYMESEKTVSQQLEVSEITTGQPLTQQTPMPICRYDVLENGPDGQPVRFATIGEQVYHKWTCETNTQDTYCMVVRNCQVQNGAGQVAQLLDENGCAVDRYLLQNLEYTGDLMAGQEAHVFKFADQPALYFQCQITISIKEPGSQCPRPACSSSPVSGTTRGGTNGGGPYGFTTQPAQYISNGGSYPPPTAPSGGVGGVPPLVGSGVSPAAYLPGQFSRRQASSALLVNGTATNNGSQSANGINSSLGLLAPNLAAFPVPNVAVLPRNRRIRSAPEPDVHEVGVWDVDAQPITALEIDENAAYYQTQAARFKNGLAGSSSSPSVISFQAGGGDSPIEERRGSASQICLNTITFGFIFSVAIAAALASGTAMIIVCKKKTNTVAKY